MLPKESLFEALSSDLYIIFGSSFIKGWLIDYLIEKRAINIHMGCLHITEALHVIFGPCMTKNQNMLALLYTD